MNFWSIFSEPISILIIFASFTSFCIMAGIVCLLELDALTCDIC